MFFNLNNFNNNNSNTNTNNNTNNSNNSNNNTNNSNSDINRLKSRHDNILFNSPRYKQSNCDFFENIYKLKEIDFLYQDVPYKKPKEELQLSNWKTPKGYNNWIEIIKSYDFIIGTRIHGAIMSLICEIPTLLLVIDSRTLELAETLNIPYLNIINKEIHIYSKKDIIDIINNFKFDYDKFNRRVEARKEEFNNYINDNLFFKMKVNEN